MNATRPPELEDVELPALGLFEPFKAVRKLGTVPSWTNAGKPTRAELFLEVTWDDEGELHFVGWTQRKRAGDWDSGGQIRETLTALDTEPIDYNRAHLLELSELWKRWHLNHLHAGCVHQRWMGWTYDEHPSEPCPVCGYQMGTAWMREEVPATVVRRLRELLRLDDEEG